MAHKDFQITLLKLIIATSNSYFNLTLNMDLSRKNKLNAMRNVVMWKGLIL